MTRSRINLRSIEARLTLWYGAMLLVGFVLFAAFLWLVVSSGVRQSVDELLEERASTLESGLRAEIEDNLEEDPEEEVRAEIEENLVEIMRTVPESHLTRVREAGGAQIFPSEDDAAPMEWKLSDAPRIADARLGDEPYRVLTARIEVFERTFLVQLASSLQSLSLLRGRFGAIVLIMVPVVSVVCLAGGWALSHAALRPLDQLADTVSSVSLRTMSARIPVPASGDVLERLSRSFNDMLERLQKSIEKIEQFSADASHELRSPLAVIKTTAELALRRQRTVDEYRADLEAIQSEVDALSELVDVLLTLARADAAEKEPADSSVSRMDVDLNRVARRVCTTMRPEVEARGVELRLEVSPTPVVVRANEPAVRRIMGSLIDNAAAHTETGWIALSVTADDAGHQFCVSDSGEGIPPEALSKIFDRFFRGDTSRSRRAGRFGLGLAIVRKIAELHGARIEVDSRLGEGSTFRVIFPPAPSSSTA